MSLGYVLEAFDRTSAGGKRFKSILVPKGTPSDLVCTVAFPTMLVMFWGENGPQQYFDSYFARFDNI